MINVIAVREFRSLFRSPIAWTIAAVMQVVFAWMFLLTLEEFINIQDTLRTRENAPGVTAFMTFRYMAPASAIFLVLCPLLSMRTFSDEYRLHTMPLLLSSPVSVAAIVLGKYIGTLALIVLLTALVAIMPVTLGLIAGIDLRTLGLAWAGLLLLGCCATAIGLFYSSLTRHTMVAAISSIATLALLWMLGKGTFSAPIVAEIFSAGAISTHLGQMFQGVLDTRELAYFALVTTLFLILTMLRIDSHKYSAF